MVSSYINRSSDKREHTFIVESVLGRPLPADAEVHHVDGNGRNNSHDNLVVCPNSAYHSMLHVRTRALAACGNANWNKCIFCKTWDDPINLTKRTAKAIQFYHKKCDALDHLVRKRGSYAQLNMDKYKSGYLSKSALMRIANSLKETK